MPGKRRPTPVGEDGSCQECGGLHLVKASAGRGKKGQTSPDLVPSCAGHVVKDKATYVKGQPRAYLDKPRPCLQKRPRDADPNWLCKYHGGNAPQVRAAQERRDIERKAAKIMRRFGEPVDTSPTEALLDAVKWTAGYVAWLRDKVAGIDEVSLAKTPAQDHERTLTQHSRVTGKRESSVWVDLLGQWHDRLVRICAEAIKAGIEERRVRIAEQQGALVADVIRKILGALDLSDEQAAKSAEVVPLELRRLAG